MNELEHRENGDVGISTTEIDTRMPLACLPDSDNEQL